MRTEKDSGLSNENLVNLLTTAEAADVLRIGRRTVEELGKKYDRAKAGFPVSEPPPSSPRFGLRRTPVTVRKHFYNESDITEYLNNCRLESDGLEPIRFDSGYPERVDGGSKTSGKTRDEGRRDGKA